MRTLSLVFALGILCGFAAGQETDNLQLKNLPAAVQKTVAANLNGGSIKNIGREKEDGVDQYEVESLLNGRTRDFNIDLKGNLLVMEEATRIDAIPVAAKATIVKKVADGKLNTIETFAKPGQPMMYEAGYTDRQGKHHEVLVKADGTETKE